MPKIKITKMASAIAQSASRPEHLPAPTPCIKMGAEDLTLAAAEGHVERVQIMLQNGVSPFHSDWEGRTPLHAASAAGHLDVVQVLLEAAPNTARIADPSLRMPLCLAAQNGHISVVSHFVNTGIATVRERSHEWELLHLAAFHGHSELVAWLLENGAQSNKDRRH